MISKHNDLTQKFIDEHLGPAPQFNEIAKKPLHGAFILAAAKRSGLTVEDYGGRQYAFFKNDELVGGLAGMIPSLVGHTALQHGGTKHIAKNLMERAGVPVAPGRSFSQTQYEEALKYFQQQSAPLVVKPTRGNGAKGVTTHVTTEAEFSRAWETALAADPRVRTILVEQHIFGLDVRAYVVGDKVVAAATRLPAFVLGDGSTPLSELIRAEKNKRTKNAYLRDLPIQVDPDWLALLNMHKDSVPSAGRVVTLNGTVNLHQGGEQVNVTSQLSPTLKTIAVRAARAIPGMRVGGVDFLVEDLNTEKGAVVLEANAHANISVHHLPAYGDSVDVGGAIVEEMLRDYSK